MPTRRGVLVALGAGLAGCSNRRRDTPTPENPPAPMDYEPITPSTPTPRESPLPIDRSFRWPSRHVDARNSARPPTTGPTDAPSGQWEAWLSAGVDTTYARIDGRWLYVFGGGELAAIDRREGWIARSTTLPVRVRTAPTVTDRGFVAGMATADGGAGLGRLETHGKLAWRRSGGNLGVPPTVAGGTVYHCEGTELVARSVDTGNLEWRYSAPGDGRFVTTPAVADGTVYVQGTRRTHAIDAAEGSVRWQRALDPQRSPTTAVSVSDGRVFAGFGRSPTFVGLDGESGDVDWTADGDVPVAVNAVGEDRLVSATAAGRVVARSLADGIVEWRQSGAVGPAVVTDDTVYVRGERATSGRTGLVAIALADGSRRWYREVSAEGWLLVADGYCYLNRGGGVIRCLGPSDQGSVRGGQGNDPGGQADG